MQAQGIQHRRRLVAQGINFPSLLFLGEQPQFPEKGQIIPLGEAQQGRLHKGRTLPGGVKIMVPFRIDVGNIAAAVAGYQQLFAGPGQPLQYGNPQIRRFLTGLEGGNQPGGPAADYDKIKILHIIYLNASADGSSDPTALSPCLS